MVRINLQHKTHPTAGYAEKYWFENEFTGLKRTLFHRICLPLHPFDSGLEYEPQPLETEIVIEWLDLALPNPDDLHNLQISSRRYEGLEASVYVGGAHNICEVLRLNIHSMEADTYAIDGELHIDFKSEGVAENETFSFQSVVQYTGFANDK